MLAVPRPPLSPSPSWAAWVGSHEALWRPGVPKSIDPSPAKEAPWRPGVPKSIGPSPADEAPWRPGVPKSMGPSPADGIPTPPCEAPAPTCRWWVEPECSTSWCARWHARHSSSAGRCSGCGSTRRSTRSTRSGVTTSEVGDPEVSGPQHALHRQLHQAGGHRGELHHEVRHPPDAPTLDPRSRLGLRGAGAQVRHPQRQPHLAHRGERQEREHGLDVPARLRCGGTLGRGVADDVRAQLAPVGAAQVELALRAGHQQQLARPAVARPRAVRHHQPLRGGHRQGGPRVKLALVRVKLHQQVVGARARRRFHSRRLRPSRGVRPPRRGGRARVTTGGPLRRRVVDRGGLGGERHLHHLLRARPHLLLLRGDEHLQPLHVAV
eukprot:464005-Prorocentrum_minimum.AAC.2